MIKIAIYRLNTSYIKIAFVLLFLLTLFSLKSFISSNNYIVKNIDVVYFINAIENTISLNKIKYPSRSDFLTSTVNDVSNCLIGFDIKKPRTVIKTQLSFLKYSDANKNVLQQSQTPVSTSSNYEFNLYENYISNKSNNNISYEPEIKPIQNTIKSEGMILKNETNNKINLKSIIDSPIQINQSKLNPHVLIYHTHTCESYKPSEKYGYIPMDNDRTTDLRFNVARVGSKLSKILTQQYGLKVIHDKTIHDRNIYERSYTKSASTLKKYLNKYPNIGLILDIHRDAANINGKKIDVSTSINGKKVAKIMAVIGTNGRGMPHPNWRKNLNLGVKFIDNLRQINPDLSRGINLKRGRFNQYLSSNSILIEVGANGNTLDAALNSTKYIAQTIVKLLKEQGKI